MKFISCRFVLAVVLPLHLCGMVLSDPIHPAWHVCWAGSTGAITTFPRYLQDNYQMQITCTYDSTVYRISQWVHPTVGYIAVGYGRFTVISNVQAGGNNMYYRLQISSPERTDAGTYYCIFTTITQGVSVSPSVALVWKDPPQYQTPTGLVYRQFVNQSMQLECNVTNYLQIQWQSPLNTPVTLNDRVQMRGTSLYFSSLSLSDSTTYLCVTNNEIAVGASITAIVMVYEAPSVQIDSTSRVVNTSGHANFTCTARGTPQPAITWTRENTNDNLILSNSGVSVVPSTSGPYTISTINFPSVNGNNTGVYRCTASNPNGSIYINVNLLLYGTPTAPTNVKVETYNSSALNVSWGPPVSNGNLNLLSYTVYWQAGRSVNSVTLVGIPLPTQYLIGGLDYLTNYSVSVVANNAKGKGYSSVPCVASTSATVPSRPVNISVEDLSSTSAIITWSLSDNGGSPILRTQLTFKDQTSHLVNAYVDADITQYQLTGLAFNSSQLVLLSSANNMGTGPSALFSFSTTDVPEAPPLVIVSIVQNVAAVCWSSTSLGQPYLLYKVKVQGEGDSSTFEVDVKPSSSTSSNDTTCITVIGLKYNTCYNFIIFIGNKHGLSLPSYSNKQVCPEKTTLPPTAVPNLSQSKLQVATVASGTVGGAILLLSLIGVGVILAVVIFKMRTAKTGDRYLDSTNSSTSSDSKKSPSSSLTLHDHMPTSTTALLKETPFMYPPPASLLLEHPHHPHHQHDSMLSVGHFNRDAEQHHPGHHPGHLRVEVAQSACEEDDGLMDNPAFMHQNSDDKDGGVWHSTLPPFLGESCSQTSLPPMFVVQDQQEGGDCMAEDGTMFVENNAYETHEFRPPSEPRDSEPRFAIASNQRGEIREVVKLKFSSKR